MTPALRRILVDHGARATWLTIRRDGRERIVAIATDSAETGSTIDEGLVACESEHVIEPLLREGRYVGALHALTNAAAEDLAALRFALRTEARTIDALDLRLSAPGETEDRARLRVLESAVEHTNDGILVLDATRPDGEASIDPRIVFTNAAFARLSGYDLGELDGAPLSRLHGPLTAPPALARITRAIAVRESLTLELLAYRKNGEAFWVELSLAPVTREAEADDRWIAVHRDISTRHEIDVLATELVRHERSGAQLAFSAFHDDLTGLHNRAYFDERLGESRLRAVSRRGPGFAVLFFDLDRFKGVNDSLGHAAGDALLREATMRIKANLRQQDLVARFGGDEFAVLVESAGDPRNVVELAERLLGALRAPLVFGDVTVSTSASMGIAIFDPRRHGIYDIVRDADTAMYRAKRAGGDRFAMFDEGMHREAVAIHRLHGDLRAAVDADAFVLHYEPIVRLTTGAVVGYESLLRWSHPTRGLLRPSAFLEAAEDSGLMIPLGTRVLARACAALRRRRDRGRSQNHVVSVNVSPAQLRDPGFVGSVYGALRGADLDPSSLRLEIPEQALHPEDDRVTASLADLRSAGVRVIVDHYGAADASVTRLERFAVDALKIDRTLVRRLEADVRARVLLRTIATLGGALGLEIFAEGVTCEAERAMLVECGYEIGQGPHLAPPCAELESLGHTA